MADPNVDQRSQCLRIIRASGYEGVTTLELEHEGIPNPTMRISELRKAGHVIRGEKVEGLQCHRYRWIERKQADQVDRDAELAEALLAERALDAKPPAILADLDHAHGELRVLAGRLVLVPLGKGKAPVLVCGASLAGKLLWHLPRGSHEVKGVVQGELFSCGDAHGN